MTLSQTKCHTSGCSTWAVSIAAVFSHFSLSTTTESLITFATTWDTWPPTLLLLLAPHQILGTKHWRSVFKFYRLSSNLDQTGDPTKCINSASRVIHEVQTRRNDRLFRTRERQERRSYPSLLGDIWKLFATIMICCRGWCGVYGCRTACFAVEVTDNHWTGWNIKRWLGLCGPLILFYLAVPSRSLSDFLVSRNIFSHGWSHGWLDILQSGSAQRYLEFQLGEWLICIYRTYIDNCRSPKDDSTTAVISRSLSLT